jgi:hypothetical protein
VPNVVQNSVGQRTYHVYCYQKCNNDTQSKPSFGWIWDWPSMWDFINNKCESKLLSKKNANAFLRFHFSLGMSSYLQNSQLTK